MEEYQPLCPISPRTQATWEEHWQRRDLARDKYRQAVRDSWDKLIADLLAIGEKIDDKYQALDDPDNR